MSSERGILNFVLTGVLVLVAGNLPWAGVRRNHWLECTELSATPPTLVWENGVDTSFAVTTMVFIVLAVVTARAYIAIGRSRVRGLAAIPSVDRDTVAV